MTIVHDKADPSAQVPDLHAQRQVEFQRSWFPSLGPPKFKFTRISSSSCAASEAQLLADSEHVVQVDCDRIATV